MFLDILLFQKHFRAVAHLVYENLRASSKKALLVLDEMKRQELVIAVGKAVLSF